MRQFNKFRGTKGFIVLWERVLRFRYMITEQAKERCRILCFWEKHGDLATYEAFKVSRPTLFRWQKALKQGNGKLEGLNPNSRCPKNKRRRIVPQNVKDFIINERKFDPKLSKDKLAVLMKQDGIANLSASTVGRMLNDLKKRGGLPIFNRLTLNGRTGKLMVIKPKPINKKLRSKGHTGGLVKADTVVRFINGIKRYVITAIDKETKFAFAYSYKNHSSLRTAEFMNKFKTVAPVSLTHVQTDNGSEFNHHFDVFLENNDIVHFHSYPRCPKMNTEIERFNRTLSDAFIKQNRMLLAYDITAFNQKLVDWLLWYNTRRPHWSLGLVSPLRYICNQLQLSAKESHMWWTDTKI